MARHRKTARSGLTSSSCKATNLIIGAPPTWPHLILTASHEPHLQMPLIYDFEDRVSHTWTVRGCSQITAEQKSLLVQLFMHCCRMEGFRCPKRSHRIEIQHTSHRYWICILLDDGLLRYHINNQCNLHSQSLPNSQRAFHSIFHQNSGGAPWIFRGKLRLEWILKRTKEQYQDVKWTII